MSVASECHPQGLHPRGNWGPISAIALDPPQHTPRPQRTEAFIDATGRTAKIGIVSIAQAEHRIPQRFQPGKRWVGDPRPELGRVVGGFALAPGGGHHHPSGLRDQFIGRDLVELTHRHAVALSFGDLSHLLGKRRRTARLGSKTNPQRARPRGGLRRSGQRGGRDALGGLSPTIEQRRREEPVEPGALLATERCGLGHDVHGGDRKSPLRNSPEPECKRSRHLASLPWRANPGCSPRAGSGSRPPRALGTCWPATWPQGRSRSPRRFQHRD